MDTKSATYHMCYLCQSATGNVLYASAKSDKQECAWCKQVKFGNAVKNRPITPKS